MTTFLETPSTVPSLTTTNGFRVHARNPQCWHIPTRAISHPGFRSWVGSDSFPEKVRTAFVDGEIILDINQEEITTHAGVKAGSSNVLMNLVNESKTG